MTNKEISSLLQSSETKFQRCWSVLESMKRYKIDRSEFPYFQPTLAEAIFYLSLGYNKISKIRNELISKKTSYSPIWFARRQKILGNRQKILNDAISIGKNLGDAFVWFFYQRDRELLLEHAKHPPILHISAGLGGVGEKEFITRTKVVGPFMVLYHGTTTLLRIGDITLIDLRNFRVAAIGELKTGPAIPGKLSMIFQLVGQNQNFKSFLKNTRSNQSEKTPDYKLSPAIQARLDKQIKEISRALSANDNKTDASIIKEERRSIAEFEKLALDAKMNQFTNGKLGRGLLCSIYKQRVSSLKTKLISKRKTDFLSKTEDLPQQVKSIIIEGSPHNDLIMCPLLYSKDGKAPLLPGAIPVFWWPIQVEILKKIIFQDMMVMNIFNPAHLIEALKSKGYNLLPDKNRKLRLIKKIGKATLELKGVSYFLRLIYHDMFDEDQIIELIASVEETTKEKHKPGITKVDIRFNHVFDSFNNFVQIQDPS